MYQPVYRDGAVKTVFVTAYTRFRFGKLGWVTAHYRSWPR